MWKENSSAEWDQFTKLKCELISNRKLNVCVFDSIVYLYFTYSRSDSFLKIAIFNIEPELFQNEIANK